MSGVGLGSVGLVYFNYAIFGRRRVSTVVPAGVGADAGSSLPTVSTSVTVEGRPPTDTHSTLTPSSPLAGRVVARPGTGELSPRTLALLIATGIGLHNFAEGLAIGQSAVVGALQLALVLIIGFGLHNMTEGFGISGPLTGQAVTWRFMILLGLIGGGPTFLGTMIGISFPSPQVFILFLALAAGAIIYVVAELLGLAKRFKAPELVMWGLLLGFLLGYATDLLVTFGGRKLCPLPKPRQ
jgi:zinc transporter, ZIP family